MNITDPVADMLTRIRNGIMAGHLNVDIKLSKLKVEIVKILKNEGFIKNFKKISLEEAGDVIRVFLKYDENEKSIIHGLKSVSTPGCRVYSGYKSMPRVYNGFGTVIVSTSFGVTTGKKAVAKKIGGEIICTVW